MTFAGTAAKWPIVADIVDMGHPFLKQDVQASTKGLTTKQVLFKICYDVRFDQSPSDIHRAAASYSAPELVYKPVIAAFYSIWPYDLWD